VKKQPIAKGASEKLPSPAMRIKGAGIGPQLAAAHATKNGRKDDSAKLLAASEEKDQDVHDRKVDIKRVNTDAWKPRTAGNVVEKARANSDPNPDISQIPGRRSSDGFDGEASLKHGLTKLSNSDGKSSEPQQRWRGNEEVAGDHRQRCADRKHIVIDRRKELWAHRQRSSCSVVDLSMYLNPSRDGDRGGRRSFNGMKLATDDELIQGWGKAPPPPPPAPAPRGWRYTPYPQQGSSEECGNGKKPASSSFDRSAISSSKHTASRLESRGGDLIGAGAGIDDLASHYNNNNNNNNNSNNKKRPGMSDCDDNVTASQYDNNKKRPGMSNCDHDNLAASQYDNKKRPGMSNCDESNLAPQYNNKRTGMSNCDHDNLAASQYDNNKKKRPGMSNCDHDNLAASQYDDNNNKRPGMSNCDGNLAASQYHDNNKKRSESYAGDESRANCRRFDRGNPRDIQHAEMIDAEQEQMGGNDMVVLMPRRRDSWAPKARLQHQHHQHHQHHHHHHHQHHLHPGSSSHGLQLDARFPRYPGPLHQAFPPYPPPPPPGYGRLGGWIVD
jgi:hypothetical protein